jgi:hypothetical protein
VTLRDLRPIDWYDFVLDAGPVIGAAVALVITVAAEKQTGHLVGGPSTREARCGAPSVAEQPYALPVPDASPESP